MEKEEILKKSREENEGRRDEREAAASGTAAKAGMLVGGLICAALAFAGRIVLKTPDISLVGWLVYFAMYGAGNIVLFKELGGRRNLIWGVIASVLAAALAVAVVVKNAG